MQFSVSAVLISLLSASLIIGIAAIVLHYHRMYKNFRVGLLYSLLLLAFVRLAVPVELIYTKTIASKHVLPVFYEFGHTQVYHAQHVQISMFLVLLVVWIGGAVIALGRYLRNQVMLRATIAQLANQSQTVAMPFVDAKTQVYVVPATITAFTYGIVHPQIFLPGEGRTEAERAHIARHEYQHVKNHDVLQKNIVQLLVCVYWWFPLVYLLRAEFNILMELRVDGQVVHQMADEEYVAYMRTLVSVAKRMQQRPAPLADTVVAVPAFLEMKQGVLERRINFLMEKHTIKKTNRFILLLVVILPYLMTSIIVEPDYIDPHSDAANTSEVDGKNDFVLHENNKYYLYIDGKRFGQIDHPNSGEMKDLPHKEK